MGYEDDGEELSFHFEHIPAKSLSRLMYDARLESPSYKMDEFSPLYRHWAREVLVSLRQLHEQCPHVLLNAFSIGPENCMVARQGTSMRLGRLLWGPVYDPTAGEGSQSRPKAFFRERECALLRGFGRILRSMLSSDVEEESLKRFVPADSVTIDVGKLVESEELESIGESSLQDPLVFPASIQVGQRLVIELPPCSALPHVQNDSKGALGASVCWHDPVVSKVGGATGAGEIPMRVVENGSSAKKMKRTVVLFASRPGLCDIQLPFYDPSMKKMPNANCVLSVACEVVKPPCSSVLKAIMKACLNSQNERDGFSTLKSLLDHRYFEALGVKELEDVMSAYESQFAKGARASSAAAAHAKSVL